jgi:tetratricopeptide (TPR) repeat protein
MRVLAFVSLLLAVSGAAWAQQPSKPNDEAKERARLAAEYHKAKAAYAKNSRDKKTRSDYVEATVAYGNAVMMSPNLIPKDKYPQALKLFREALKVDPGHKQAKANKTMIEDIYKSMGRPVPG